MQYYVAGRYAARAKLIRVCANILHHAVELFLKGYLVKTHTAQQLANRPFRHNLNHAWSVFKALIADPALDQFDDTIATLDAFEHIRYPDVMAAEGGALIVSWERSQEPLPFAGSDHGVPSYRLNIPQLDRLIREIFTRSSINPTFFTSSMHVDAQQYLFAENGPFTGWFVE
jgi:hypothetical protein